MKPVELPPLNRFECNICGTANGIAPAAFHREMANCVRCGSVARFRGIIAALGRELFDTTAPLKDWDARPDVRGVGMSDAGTYAEPLAQKFAYLNTFYDRAPQMDIAANALPFGELDFVISTDVLEHVSPPIQRGFDGLYNLLKPGGVLVFSVPYTSGELTKEHYPELHTWTIVDFAGEKVMVNRTETGAMQAFDKLFFHGGEGATLELRVFGRKAVLDGLRAAGFSSIREWNEPMLEVGYYWPDAVERADHPPFLGHVITARR